MGAGIPLIRALRVAREVLVNSVLTRELARVEEDVRGGAGLGVSLEKTKRFPTLLHSWWASVKSRAAPQAFC